MCIKVIVRTIRKGKKKDLDFFFLSGGPQWSLLEHLARWWGEVRVASGHGSRPSCPSCPMRPAWRNTRSSAARPAKGGPPRPLN